MKILDRSIFWVACLWLIFIVQWLPATSKPIRGICFEMAQSDKLGPSFNDDCKRISENYERKDLPLFILGTSLVLVIISYRLKRLSESGKKAVVDLNVTRR